MAEVLRLPGPPLRFFTTAPDASPDPDRGTGTDTTPGPQAPVEVTRTGHTAPPTLGQHNTAIRTWLGQ